MRNSIKGLLILLSTISLYFVAKVDAQDILSLIDFTESESNSILIVMDKFSDDFWISYEKDEYVFELVYKGEDDMMSFSEDLIELNNETKEYSEEKYTIKVFDKNNLEEPSFVIENDEIISNNQNSENIFLTNNNSSNNIGTPTREQKNALETAYDYLDYTSFSYSGLYDQLLYEGYPADAAQYAMDNLNVDWKNQALQTAQDYLDYTSFSDQGLYDQLIYEGFSAEEAQYAIDNLD